MKKVGNQEKKAINEKHLLTLLEENKMLMQAVRQLHQDIFENSKQVEISQENAIPSLHLIQDDVPALLDSVTKVEMLLKGCYKTPSSVGITNISKLHFKCITQLQEIKVRLSSN